MEELLFTVGPVQMYENTKKISAQQIPYFRTNEFSKINNRIVENLKKCMFTSQDSKVALLTASGTAAMEAAVCNIFNNNDKLLIIVGGGFGRRFVDICRKYEYNIEVLELEQGKVPTSEQLERYKDRGITGVLVNIHETSTGVLYDGKSLGNFCHEIGAVFVVDAISSFLADEYKMDEWNIDATIISSQKALALHPGMAAVIVNNQTYKKIMCQTTSHYYLDLKEYFRNMERGQTPFTTAVGITLQLDDRLKQICSIGIDHVIESTRELAVDFRKKISELPFSIPSESLSNAMTPIKLNNTENASRIFELLKKEYGIVVNPCGGTVKEKMLRIGHIGNITIGDNDRLIHAFIDLQNRGIL
ncbi:pyridoxal-phosphate-dependent aminotransferase family protein [Anaerosporobacter faecicola]|uniref:pyridoxal-phosphate-dependent aminotransferase family protein n=1 Tax=Anaerosporobacter faecicola TaxID=2718714 RepID=UPI00143B37DF|nr:aminotransferase class V-fold PLP-dependent enzyme [Anaerosporobacter faecicola]